MGTWNFSVYEKNILFKDHVRMRRQVPTLSFSLTTY